MDQENRFHVRMRIIEIKKKLRQMTMEYHGLPWYTMDYHGSSWSYNHETMVDHVIPWSTIDYHRQLVMHCHGQKPWSTMV